MPTDVIRRAITPIIRSAFRRFTPGSALRAIRQGELRPYPSEEGNLNFLVGAPLADNEIIASFTSPALLQDPNRDNRLYLPGTLPLRDPNLRISYRDPNDGTLHINERIPENLDEARRLLEEKLAPRRPSVTEEVVAPVSNTSSERTGLLVHEPASQEGVLETQPFPMTTPEQIEYPGRMLSFPVLLAGQRHWTWDSGTGTMRPYRTYERFGAPRPNSREAIHEVLRDARPNDYLTPHSFDLSTDSFLSYLSAIRHMYGTGRGQVTASITEGAPAISTNGLGDASVTWQDFIDEVNKLPDSDALKQDIITSITQHPEIAPHEWRWRNDVKDAQIIDILTNLYNQKAAQAMAGGKHSYERLVAKDKRLRPGLDNFRILPFRAPGYESVADSFLRRGYLPIQYEYPQITATLHRRGGLFWPKNYK